MCLTKHSGAVAAGARPEALKVVRRPQLTAAMHGYAILVIHLDDAKGSWNSESELLAARLSTNSASDISAFLTERLNFKLNDTIGLLAGIIRSNVENMFASRTYREIHAIGTAMLYFVQKPDHF